nr:DNA-directed RNA polymerase III subunit RPC7-like [Dermacentor andersoni]
MFTAEQLGFTKNQLEEAKHSEPPPRYPPPDFSPAPSVNSEKNKRLASGLCEQRRNFSESCFNVPPPEESGHDDRYHRQVYKAPDVNYDFSYFPTDLHVSNEAKKTKKTHKSTRASDALAIEIDIQKELQAQREREMRRDSDDEGEDEAYEKKSKVDENDVEEELDSDEEAEVEEAMDYVHNYDDDEAFSEDDKSDEGATY